MNRISSGITGVQPRLRNISLAIVAAGWVFTILAQWYFFHWKVVPYLATALEALGQTIYPFLIAAITGYLYLRTPLVLAAVAILFISPFNRPWVGRLLVTVLIGIAFIQVFSAVAFVFGSVQVTEAARNLFGSSSFVEP